MDDTNPPQLVCLVCRTKAMGSSLISAVTAQKGTIRRRLDQRQANLSLRRDRSGKEMLTFCSTVLLSVYACVFLSVCVCACVCVCVCVAAFVICMCLCVRMCVSVYWCI